MCLSLCQSVVSTPLPLHQPHKQTVEMFLITANQVLLHESGIFASQCGYYQALETCETKFKFLGKKWWQACQQKMKSNKVTFPLLFAQMSSGTANEMLPSASEMMRGICLTNTSLEWKMEDRVFVVTSLWDHNYHHWLIDCLARLIRFLPFLKENPDIKIHMRHSDQYLKRDHYRIVGKKIRTSFLKLLGLSPDRLVFGPTIVKELYYPRAIKCNYPLAHAHEIRLLVKTLLLNANTNLDSVLQIPRTDNAYPPFIVKQKKSDAGEDTPLVSQPQRLPMSSFSFSV